MASADHSHPSYFKIYVWLLILFVISVVGPYFGEILEMRLLTLITAFGIALVKTYLVCAYFMHLKVEKKYIWYLLGLCIALLAVFVGGTAGDVMNWEGDNWRHDPTILDHYDPAAFTKEDPSAAKH